MSELINTQQARNAFRWQLLSTVSSLALVTAICVVQDANAEDVDRPTVWIELGVDLERIDSGQQAFLPPFVANNPGSNAFDPVSPAEAQRPPGFSFGEEGKILLQPDDSNWVFSASVFYGRANGNRHVHQEHGIDPVHRHLSYNGPYFHNTSAGRTYVPPTHNFLDVIEKQSESHAVADFQVGKDVGLGLFGRMGSSIFSAGVRFAQFTSSMQSNLKARPDLGFAALHFPTLPYEPHLYGTGLVHHYHQYIATASSTRNFHGIGPSLSWNASAPIAGNSANGELTLDWGANAAILFGRQKANVQHVTTAQYFYNDGYIHGGTIGIGHGGAGYQHPLVSRQRVRSLIVPNAGGFAGISYRIEDFKVALGYRGDFFFGAMDTGFDTAKKSTIGFYGPFTSVSIGIGG